MARSTVILVKCDSCGKVIGNDQQATFSEYIITKDKKTFYIDLCSACADDYIEPLLGVPAPKRVVKKTAQKKTAAPIKSAKCPKCGKKFANAHGVQVHIARSHK